MRYRVVSNPNILYGTPVIAGTRVAVEWIYHLLAIGVPAQDIFRELDLSEEQQIIIFQYGHRLIKRLHRMVGIRS